MNEEKMHRKQQAKKREKMRRFKGEYLILINHSLIQLYTILVVSIYHLLLGVGDTKISKT